MSFVSIGDLAKQKFKEILPETTKIYSSVGFNDCVEILCGQFAAQSLHELYEHNGMMVIAATSVPALELAKFREPDLVNAFKQLGRNINSIKIL